ncbi:MAG: hypothetical protein AAGH99_08665 [Planctomycetota bacterium]
MEKERSTAAYVVTIQRNLRLAAATINQIIDSGDTEVAQLKDKVGSFFAWARKDKPPVSVDVTRRDGEVGQAEGSPEASREVTLQQIKQGYVEVVETMKSVRGHLEQQADRSERMLNLLEDLPEALRSLPETARTQTGVLQGIQSHLEDQNQTSQKLTEAITGLATASSHQQRSLASLDSHLADGQETRSQLNDGVAALTDTLGEVRESNAATRESIGAVVDQTRQNEAQMREMMQRNHKTNTLMMILCLALATGALALGGYVAVMVGEITRDAAPAAASPAEESSPPASDVSDAAGVEAVIDEAVAGISLGPAESPNAYRVVVSEEVSVTPEVEAPVLVEPAPAEADDFDLVGPPAPPQ